MQYRSMSATYHLQYPNARFEIVELSGHPAGRRITDVDTERVYYVDIAMLPELQRGGVASALMNAALAEPRASVFPPVSRSSETTAPRCGYARKPASPSPLRSRPSWTWSGDRLPERDDRRRNRRRSESRDRTFYVILYFSKITLIRLIASSTACSGVMFFWVTMASACGHTSSEMTWA